MGKQKVIMLITLITGILLVTTGITYSLFTSSKISKNSSLVVGDVYMNYNETNELTIENAMPSSTFDKTKYFEFTVTGKNTTTNKDIWYEIVLNHGNNHETRTERIKDSLLKFRLTSVDNNVETEIFTDKSYSSLLNKRIYVDTINKNTTSEVTKTYRLYMWVSNSTKIGNTSNSTYDITTWNNQVYGSIKVNVSGDFLEKYIVAEEVCFECENNTTGVTITNYDASCGSKIAIPETINNKKVTRIKSNAFKNKKLELVSIPSSVTTIDSNAFTDNNIENIIIPDTVTNLGCKSFDENVTSNRDMTCIETDESCFTVGTINNDNEVVILDYDATCGSDVVIPSTIKGYPVTAIAGDSNKSSITPIKNNLLNDLNNKNLEQINPRKLVGERPNGGAFSNKDLVSIIFPDTLTTIGNAAFYINSLKEIVIPDSVITIESNAFEWNDLESITIGNGIKYIGSNAFQKASYSNSKLSSIKVDKGCVDIKNILGSSTNTTKYYPWLSSSSPYTASGVTIYGTDGVCDSY